MYENEQEEDMFCVTLNNMTPKDVRLYCRTYGLCYRPSDHKGYDLAGNIEDVRNMLEDYIGRYSEIGKIMDEGIYVPDWNRDKFRCVDSKKIKDATYVDYNDNGGPFKTLEDLEQHAYDYNLEVKVIYPDYISMYCDQWVIKGDRKDIEAFIDRYYNKDQKEYITDSKKIKDSDKKAYPMANPKEVRDIIRSVKHDIENHSDEGYTKDDINYCIGMELSARDLRCTPHLFLPDHIGPEDQEWKDMVQGYLDNGGREQNITDSKKIKDASEDWYIIKEDDIKERNIDNVPFYKTSLFGELIKNGFKCEWVAGDLYTTCTPKDLETIKSDINFVNGPKTLAEFYLKPWYTMNKADYSVEWKSYDKIHQRKFASLKEAKAYVKKLNSLFKVAYVELWDLNTNKMINDKKVKDSDPWHENAHYELTYDDGSKENDTIPVYIKRDMSDEELIEYFQGYHPEDKIVSVKQIGWSRMGDSKKIKDSDYNEVPSENIEALKECLDWYGIFGYTDDIIEVFESQEAFVDDELIEYDNPWDALDAYLTWEGILNQTDRIYDLLVNGYDSPFYDSMLRDKASYDED